MAWYAHIYAEEKNCGIEEWYKKNIAEQLMNMAHLEIIGKRRRESYN